MHGNRLSRREFIQLSSLVAVWTALSACGAGKIIPEKTPADTPHPSTQTQESLPKTTATPAPPVDKTLKVLRRFSFGLTKQDLQKAREEGLVAYIEDQLRSQTDDNPTLKTKLAYLTLFNETDQEIRSTKEPGKIASDLILATIMRQIYSEKQVYEMLVDFWTNHFNIFIQKNPLQVLKFFDDRDVIRPNALASFSKLLTASAHSPAMLVYLDQQLSKKGSPNENYARELLELHTLGINGGYTQKDVSETARLLTGWSVVSQADTKRSPQLSPGSFIFRPALHDDGPASIMSFSVPAGKGQQAGENLLQYLADHPATAHLIAKKFAVRFVSDSPSDALAARLAKVFSSSSGDTKAMVRALINDSELFSPYALKIKRPLEYFVSVLRVTVAEIDPSNRNIRQFSAPLQMMGQIPFQWAPPDGYPDYASWWINTSGLLTRWNFALQLVNNRFPGVKVSFDSVLRASRSPEDAIDYLSDQYLGEKLPPNARSILVSFTSEGTLKNTVPLAAALILGSPFFQYR